MQTINQVFAADAPWELYMRMRFFRLMKSSAPVDVIVYSGGREVMRAIGVEAGYWFNRDEHFDQLRIECKAGNYQIAVAENQNGGYDRVTGDVGATIKTALSVVNRPFLTVGTAEVAITNQNPGRAGLRFWNTGATNLYIGGPGLVVADAALKLAPNESWDEACAPGAAWVAISDAAGGKLKIQELNY